MLHDHSFRKAHISIGVSLVVMALGVVVFGTDLSDAESDLIGCSAFVSALACMFWLYHREDRVRERTATSSGRENAERPVAKATRCRT